MPDNANTTPDVPTAFFTDARTIAEKLETDKRDWIPAKRDDPKTIFGLVLERDTYTSTLDNRVHPTARILSNGNIEWSVIGFHGWLHTELERKDPRPGDFAAFAFLGTKPSTKAGESDAFKYAVEVERNPNNTPPQDEPVYEQPATSDSTPSPAPTPASTGDDIPF